MEREISRPESGEFGQTFDLSGALRRLRGDRKLLGDMITFFLEDYEQALSAVRHAARDGNCEKLSLAAHNLKGLAANFDSVEVVDSASAIELHAKEGDLDCSRKLVPTLEKSTARLAADLSKYRRSNRDGEA